MAKYIVNTNIFTLHDSKVMLVLSTRRYLSAYYDGIIGSWLFLPSGKLLLLGSFIMRSSSSFEAQGKVNLPRAASHYYQAFFPALFWVKYFWSFKGKKWKSLRMSQKSFLDNKKSQKNFPYVGGVNQHMENSICFVVFIFESFPNNNRQQQSTTSIWPFCCI